MNFLQQYLQFLVIGTCIWWSLFQVWRPYWRWDFDGGFLSELREFEVPGNSTRLWRIDNALWKRMDFNFAGMDVEYSLSPANVYTVTKLISFKYAKKGGLSSQVIPWKKVPAFVNATFNFTYAIESLSDKHVQIRMDKPTDTLFDLSGPRGTTSVTLFPGDASFMEKQYEQLNLDILIPPAEKIKVDLNATLTTYQFYFEHGEICAQSPCSLRKEDTEQVYLLFRNKLPSTNIVHMRRHYKYFAGYWIYGFSFLLVGLWPGILIASAVLGIPAALIYGLVWLLSLCLKPKPQLLPLYKTIDKK